MPITTSLPVRAFDQESFHRIDRQVTGRAFDIHNQLGRFLDERHYQAEMKRRLIADGFDVASEMQITVACDGFAKHYYADLLVDRGVLVELKAATILLNVHTAQTLNYLFLCGLHHATLLNFRKERVERKFVSTRLTPDDRRRFELRFLDWTPLTDACDLLPTRMQRLLSDWGAYLDPLLYRDALTHFLGGPTRVERDVPVCSADGPIGTQHMHLLSDDVAFSVTSAAHQPETVYEHQLRFLRHTSLRAVQWINLHHDRITFRTIKP